MSAPECKPVLVSDPAGLDQLLLAAGKGCARFLEAALREKAGVNVSIWDGPDGLGAVLEEHLATVGVPNKRLPELLTIREAAKRLRVMNTRRNRLEGRRR